MCLEIQWNNNFNVEVTSIFKFDVYWIHWLCTKLCDPFKKRKWGTKWPRNCWRKQRQDYLNWYTQIFYIFCIAKNNAILVDVLLGANKDNGLIRRRLSDLTRSVTEISNTQQQVTTANPFWQSITRCSETQYILIGKKGYK